MLPDASKRNSSSSEQRFLIGSAPGVTAELLDLGATITKLEVADAHGVRRNVVLSYDTAQEYASGNVFLGGVIGRYANRIAFGRCSIGESAFLLDTTDRGRHLHGEPDGFHRRRWTVVGHDERHVEFALVSGDGDQGHPGELQVAARYHVSSEALTLQLRAWTTAATIVNLTNHAYFNLDAHGSGGIDQHTLRVAADHYYPVDVTGIPEGHALAVEGTPFDFRAPCRLGPAMRSDHPQVLAARGIDHNLVLSGQGCRMAATLSSATSGLSMTLWTDQPGLQVYTGNALDGTSTAAGGKTLRQGDGIALEPQLPPDSPNQPNFPSPLLGPGQEYRSTTRWEFQVT